MSRITAALAQLSNSMLPRAPSFEAAAVDSADLALPVEARIIGTPIPRMSRSGVIGITVPSCASDETYASARATYCYEKRSVPCARARRRPDRWGTELLLPASASVMERRSQPIGSGYDMATGTVKWFNAARASVSFNLTAAARTFSSTFPQLSGPE